MGTTTRRWLATVVAAGAVLAGCGADSADTSDSAADVAFEESGEGGFEGGVAAPEVGEEPAADDAGQARDGGVGGGDEVVTFGDAVVTGRQLARTATISLEVDDVAEASRAVTAAAVAAGGFVQSADVQGGDFGTGRLTLRVPASSLDETLEAVGEIGVTVLSSGISTDDLTDQLVDLGARIENLRALEAELQELLASVENTDAEARELLAVFDRINAVRGDIERLEAQRAAASDRVALATVEVSLVARAIAPDVVEPEPEDTIGRAWAATKDAFGAVVDALIWLVVTILPVLLVTVGLPLALLWAAFRAWRRRRRDRGTPPVATPPPPSVPAPPDAATERVGVPAGPAPSEGPPPIDSD